MLTIAQLRGAHLLVPGVNALRASLLALGVGWSAWLGARLVLGGRARFPARTLALASYAVPLVIDAGAWYLVLWRW